MFPLIFLADVPVLPLPLPTGEGLTAFFAIAVGTATMLWQLYKLPRDKRVEHLQKRLEEEEAAHDRTREKLGKLAEEIYELRKSHEQA